MIKLIQAANQGWGLPSPSPFCMKVETYLRMAGVPFTSEVTLDLSKAPKGKLPYIEDSGRLIADSRFIIEHLKAEYGDPLDEGMTAAERVTAHLLSRMLEEGLYFVILYNRWQEDGPWAKTRDLYFSAMPDHADPIRRYFLDGLQRQGTGRHTTAEVSAIGRADVAALSALLGDRPFVLGEKPRSVDATVYGFLSNVLDVPMETSLSEAVREHANLTAYAARMRARYYAGA